MELSDELLKYYTMFVRGIKRFRERLIMALAGGPALFIMEA